MKNQQDARELKKTLYIVDELKKISKSLHHLDENDCNYGLTKRQETRQLNLEKKAQSLALELGYRAYHQGDPRGCALYLITDDMGDNYSSGIAICG